MLLHRIIGETSIYHDVNRVDLNNERDRVYELAREYLQSINIASLPPSILELKIGAPIMLIRNLYPKQGLLNGLA